jgi:hypothetical protein
MIAGLDSNNGEATTAAHHRATQQVATVTGSKIRATVISWLESTRPDQV